MEVYAPTAKENAAFKAAVQPPIIEYLEKQIGRPWIDDVSRRQRSGIDIGKIEANQLAGLCSMRLRSLRSGGVAHGGRDAICCGGE